jgi:hypothetical protein
MREETQVENNNSGKSNNSGNTQKEIAIASIPLTKNAPLKPEKIPMPPVTPPKKD